MATDAPSLAKELATIALQGYQWLYNADRFESGRVVCRYRPDLRPGEILRVGTFTCYMETIEHSMAALDDGSVQMRTTVTFTRGLSSEGARTVAEQGAGRGGA